MIGITKKLFNIIVLEVQGVDDEQDSGQQNKLEQVRNILLAEASLMQQKEEAAQASFKEADKNRANAWKLVSKE
jgi:hypothetical protein